MALDDLADHRQADAGALDLVATFEGLDRPQILSANSGAMPMPLSAMDSSQRRPRCAT